MLNSEGKFEFPLTEDRKKAVTSLILYEMDFVNRISNEIEETMDEIDFMTDSSVPIILHKDYQDRIETKIARMNYLETIGEMAYHNVSEIIDEYKIEDLEFF